MQVSFDIRYENCNLDFTVLDQIIADFITDEVDLMFGIATPVAKAMLTATEDNGIPVVFAAVSDPVGSQLVESMEVPGGNVTGSSDALNTNAIFDLIFTYKPEAQKIALLYNPSEDASTLPIADAKALRVLSKQYRINDHQICINNKLYPFYKKAEIRTYRKQIEELAFNPYQGKEIPYIISKEEMKKLKADK